MSEQVKATGGIPFPMLLGLVFITLKLAGIGAVAGWSWWWVLSPFWIPFALIGVVGVVGLGAGLVALVAIKLTERAARKARALPSIQIPVSKSSPLQ